MVQSMQKQLLIAKVSNVQRRSVAHCNIPCACFCLCLLWLCDVSVAERNAVVHPAGNKLPAVLLGRGQSGQDLFLKRYRN